MSGIPGHAANPQFLVCDTSALLPFLFANDVTPLRCLRSNYAIVCGIVESVEGELRSLAARKFPVTAAPLRKALSTGVLTVLTRAYLRETIPSGDIFFDSIDRDARDFINYADRGEAYSHAAANALSVPIATQDLSAVRALSRAGFELSGPILRVFDLVAFAFQIGEMPLAECESFLAVQKHSQTSLPPSFKNASFKDGLGPFYPRIQDRHFEPAGASKPVERHDNRLWVSRPKNSLGAAF